MGISRREAVTGAVALALTGVGELAYHVVSPIDPSMDARTAVEHAAADLSAMELAAWFDLAIMFYLPALVVVGLVAGARTSRLAWVGTVVGGVAALLGTGYLFAADVLVVEAAKGTASIEAYDAYLSNPVVSVAVLVYLLGFALAMVLLGIALARSGAVARWTGAVLPGGFFVGLVGAATGMTPVVVLGDLMVLAVFAVCAKVLFEAASAATSATETAPV